MTREMIIEYVGEWFNAETHDDNGNPVDIYNDYDWQAGCNHDGIWLNLAEIVDLVEHICESEGV